MKYWKEIRNQRSVWLFAGGFVLLLGVMTGMLCTLRSEERRVGKECRL